MNNSRQNDAKEVLQWSRRRWMGAAIGAALPLLVMGRDVEAGVVGNPILLPASGPVSWSRIPDPANPGKFLHSFQSSDAVKLLSVPAAGIGERHATWSMTGLTPGYYSVRLYYPKHAGNASSALVQKRNVSKESSFVTWKTRLDQRKGAGDTTLSNSFVNVSKSISPYASSNSDSYIWVDAIPGTTKGTLQIRLSDSGCYTGRIVADSVGLDFITNAK